MSTSTARITRYAKGEPYLATTASVEDGLVSLYTHTTPSLMQKWSGTRSWVHKSQEIPDAVTLKYPVSEMLLGQTAIQIVSTYLERSYFGHTITSTVPSHQDWLARTIACGINTVALPTGDKAALSTYVLAPMHEYIGSALFTVVDALEQADLTQISAIQFRHAEIEPFQIPDVR